jgi:hypothetical protein
MALPSTHNPLTFVGGSVRVFSSARVEGETVPEDQTIVRYVINPGVGIACVGNAPDEFFIGPETPGQQPSSPVRTTAPDGTIIHHWKDSEGRVLRQAARFRVYGLNAAGEAVEEVVDSDRVTIRWRVHLANRKAAWYAFQNAMDLGDRRAGRAPSPD